MSFPVDRPRGPLPVAIALAFGIAAAPVIDVPRSAAGVFALVLVVVAARRRWLTLGAVAASGVALGSAVPWQVPPGAIVDDRGADRIAGVIEGQVVKTRDGYVAELGDVWVWTDERVRSGEHVAVTGKLKTAAGDRRLEINAAKLERLGDEPDAIDRVLRWAQDTQETWSKRIDDAGGDPLARAALRGIVVGDRTAIPESLDARWRAVGVFHVLSVSGLHLAVVAGLAFALLRRLVAASPIGGRVRTARWAAPPALAIAIAYTLVTGAQIATLRALVVIVLVLVAQMIDRPIRLLDAIGVAAIGILVVRPQDLFDPSFQLSFTAALVLAIVPSEIEARGVRAWIRRAVLTSLWVTLATAPITAFHFQQVQPGGVVGNLLLTPVLELIALPFALVGVVVDWSAPIAIAVWIVEQVDALAGVLEVAMPLGRIAIADAITLVILVPTTLVLAAGRRRAVGWIIVCVTWSLAGMPAATGELRVTFVDVGQGDAAIIELPDGAVWLVDAGGTANASKAIARTLAIYGKHRIDLALISHPHPDHFAGLANLDIPIDELWSARELEPQGGSFAALAARSAKHVHPPLGIARSQAGVDLIVWAPRYEEPGVAPTCAADPVRSVNDNSLVVEIRYRGRTILFAGDLEAEGEHALVAAGLAPVDVVKVPHHGSPTSSTQAFVDAARPTIAVISCGRANQFGFPSVDVVERWRTSGASVARTDRTGSVMIRVDAAGRVQFATPVR